MANSENASVKAREGVDREKLYPIDEAVKMVKERAKAKFDETIEVAMNLGVDPRTPIRWCAASSRCRTAPAAPCGWRVCARRRRPTRPGPPAPTSSAPRTWSRR